MFENELTLEQALEEGRVFVLNKSKPKGDILITFTQPSSGEHFIAKVHKTWIPICISDAVPLKVISESVDFRSYLRSKVLTLIGRTESEKILATEEAKDEMDRLYTSKYAERSTSNIASKNSEVDNFIKKESLIVKDILERTKNSKINVVLNELRTVQEELTKKDLIYIIKKCEGKIRSWAERVLKSMYSDEDDKKQEEDNYEGENNYEDEDFEEEE